MYIFYVHIPFIVHKKSKVCVEESENEMNLLLALYF